MTVQGSGSIGLPKKTAMIPSDGRVEIGLGCVSSSHSEHPGNNMNQTVTTTQYRVQTLAFARPLQGTTTYDIHCGVCGGELGVKIRSHVAAMRRRATLAIVSGVILLAVVVLIAFVLNQDNANAFVKTVGLGAICGLLISAFPKHWDSLGSNTTLQTGSSGRPHSLLYGDDPALRAT